jgi:hypothetical protein
MNSFGELIRSDESRQPGEREAAASRSRSSALRSARHIARSCRVGDSRLSDVPHLVLETDVRQPGQA